MKRIIISSIAVLSIIGGGLFYMNNDITENMQPDNKIVPVPIDWSAKPIVYDGSTTEFKETLQPVVEPKTIETTPVGNYTDKGINELMAEKAPSSYNLLPLMFRLKNRFPERFTPERIEESMDYVLSNFDLTKVFQSDQDIWAVEFNTGW